MSLINPTSYSSASVALRLLTDAAARQSSPSNAASPAAAGPSGNTKIILSAKAASEYFGFGSEIIKSVAGMGDTVEVYYSGLDVPGDKAAFRQQVLDFLKGNSADARGPEREGFRQALKDGKVIVRTVDESPELNWQPNVGWAIYQDGYSQGGGITTGGTGDRALYDNMSATRGQTIGQISGHLFYAYYEK